MDILFTNPSPPVAAAAAIFIITILIFYKERLHVIIKSHKVRWELRKIAAQKSNECGDDNNGNDGQPRVSGIFIHPGKCLARNAAYNLSSLLTDNRVVLYNLHSQIATASLPLRN